MTCIFIVPNKWGLTKLKMRTRGPLSEILKYMLKQMKIDYDFKNFTNLRQFKFKIQCFTFTLSTQSIFRFSGIVVIQFPSVCRKNIPCSAANHILYSPKFCKWSQSTNINADRKTLTYVSRTPHQEHSGHFHWGQLLSFLGHYRAFLKVLLNLDAT